MKHVSMDRGVFSPVPYRISRFRRVFVDIRRAALHAQDQHGGIDAVGHYGRLNLRVIRPGGAHGGIDWRATMAAYPGLVDQILAAHPVPPAPRDPTQILLVPVPMLLTCPSCGTRHVDEGEWATLHHHTHACQGCGMCWRPAVVATVGVQFLAGFENAPTQTPVTR